MGKFAGSAERSRMTLAKFAPRPGASFRRFPGTPEISINEVNRHNDLLQGEST